MYEYDLIKNWKLDDLGYVSTTIQPKFVKLKGFENMLHKLKSPVLKKWLFYVRQF